MEISKQMDQIDAPSMPLFDEKEGAEEELNPIQFGKRYIGVSLKGRWLWIDQQRAHRQVLFERYLKQMEQGRGPVQQLLFPEQVAISHSDAQLLEEMHTEIAALGFDIEISPNGALVKGLPAEMAEKSADHFLQDFLRQYLEEDRIQLTSSEKLAWSLAKSSAVKKGQSLSVPEMRDIVRRLFECEQSEFTRSGKTICKTLSVDQIDEQFF
jgi:DNA mismatch repair protein MutL